MLIELKEDECEFLGNLMRPATLKSSARSRRTVEGLISALTAAQTASVLSVIRPAGLIAILVAVSLYPTVARCDMPLSEVRGIIAATVFVIVGLFVLWISSGLMEIKQDATLVALLILPVIVFLAFSGRLRELKAGPLEAKLSEPVAAKTAFEELAVGTRAQLMQDIERVVKEGPDRLPAIIQKMEGDKPPVLYLLLGEHYAADDIEKYLRNLGHFRGFKFVVIAQPDGRVIGYIPHYVLARTLNFDDRAEALLQLILQADEQKLRRHLDIRTTFITPTTTNRKALQLMLDEQIEALLVLDDQEKLRGVVERDQLVSRLLLSLTE
jgi:CBS domain-containing protein